jgi:hypothetical protein
MAISVLLRFRMTGDALKAYDMVIDDMGVRSAPPKGVIYHFAARIPDGLFVADAWDTRPAFDRFAGDQILPLAQKHGFNPPDIEYSDIYNIIDGGIASTHGTGMVAQFEGNTEELLRKYDAVNAKMGAVQTALPGLIFHQCTKRPDGIRIIDHWRSRGEFESMLNGALGEALRSAGMPQPRIDFYEIYNTLDARRARVS